MRLARSIRSFALLTALALYGGCAAPSDTGPEITEDQEVSITTSSEDEDVDLKVAEAALTASAARTCKPLYLTGQGGVARYAEGRCRRRNGSWIWSSWSGSCTSDIANCDGYLRCGRC